MELFQALLYTCTQGMVAVGLVGGRELRTLCAAPRYAGTWRQSRRGRHGVNIVDAGQWYLKYLKLFSRVNGIEGGDIWKCVIQPGEEQQITMDLDLLSFDQDTPVT